MLAQVAEAAWALVDALDFSHEKLYLWFSVDLSSHNETFGIFYKGYFYNYRESIQWKFSDIGKKAREYGDLIGAALSVSPGARLVDGINAIQGKSWQTYMAGKLSLSSEVATLAGIPGLGFATVNDARPWVDTPMDTLERLELLDNTLVVFTSDHGTHFADNPQRVVGKPHYSLWPGVMSLPLPMHVPGGEHGGCVVDDLVYNLDTTATIYDTAGITDHQPMDG